MLFHVCLYISLSIFGIGLLYKILAWFSRGIGIEARDVTLSARWSGAARGVAGTVFSHKLLVLIKVFILDVILQIRTLKEDPLRWLMHLCIYWGFMLLLFMHALDQIITSTLFNDYYATLNPFLFLRDFFGAMVIVGLGLAVCRRFVLKVPRLKTHPMDHYAVFILAVIICSGFVVEGLEITSHSEFQSMVEDYAVADEDAEVRALESLWAKEFGLVSPNVEEPFDAEEIAYGRELNEEYCAYCHASNKWAFAGYGVAKLVKPVALGLDRGGAVTFLWYLHWLACFLGLAYLPFSKMFHLVATPASLLTNAVMRKETSSRANMLTRRAIELDACTHCGTCSRYCSAMMASEARENPYILPSEKMSMLKRMTGGKTLSREQYDAIVEGVYLCTNCDRCTVVCPAGIDLKELWMAVREELIQKRGVEPLMLSPFSLVRGLNRKNLPEEIYTPPIQETQKALAGDFESIVGADRPFDLQDGKKGLLEDSDNTYACCFGCQTCTTVCPVVKQYENPVAHLGLLPHQIMYCLGSGLTEAAAGARMLWVCLTCYQCQESCPQQVKITDLFYELKNLAVRKIRN